MSAPRTNIEKQKSRHKGPLIGMTIGVAFALVLLFGLAVYVVDRGQPPENTAPQIDSRSGDVIPPDQSTADDALPD